MNYTEILNNLVNEANEFSRLMNYSDDILKVEYLTTDHYETLNDKQYKKLTINVYKKGIKIYSFNIITDNEDEEYHNAMFNRMAKQYLLSIMLTKTVYEDIEKGIINSI